MEGKKRILIVDDHPLFRDGLKANINRCAMFRVVGEAGTSSEAWRMALELAPDLVLLDISLPEGSGIHVAKRIKKALPNAIIAMVSVHTESSYIAASFEAGASGYLFKSSLPETLLQALETMSQGGCYFQGPVPPEVIERMAHSASNSSPDAQSRYESLTFRQQEVMKLLVQGLPPKAIAEQLGISPRTLEKHRSQIMKRLGVEGYPQLLRFAAAMGLVNIDS
jgi:DNA-binding NarL/FixJ family response regulator